MTDIECPKCKKKVDIDRPSVVTEEDGLDLKVKCPECRTQFVIERVKEVRKKLLTASFAYVKKRDGTIERVRI